MNVIWKPEAIDGLGLKIDNFDREIDFVNLMRVEQGFDIPFMLRTPLDLAVRP